MTKRRATAGTSLLETMFALLVMAMMAMMVSGTLSNSVRVLTRSGVVSDEIEFAMARRDVRRWLEQALSLPEPGKTGPVFVGAESSFSADVLAPDPLFWPGKAAVLRLDTGPSLFATGVDASGRPTRRVFSIAPEGHRLMISYWGRPTESSALAWRTSWSSALGPPILMKISFAGQGRPIPPLTIRVGKAFVQSEMSLSSLVPPALPSRP